MSTPILVLNCGSSSIKYQVIDTDTEMVWATGLVEKIGLADSELTHTTPDREETLKAPLPDHDAALHLVVKAFADIGPDLSEVVAVGHRTVHGGDRFRDTVLIDDNVIQGLIELSGLAPLHNPPGVAGIKAAQDILPNVPHAAIFDTAFFATLPPESYTYAIDTTVAHQYGIRKYGFHGTSHSYVSKKTAEVLGRDLASFNQIVCHLGNGASISAIKRGMPVETSMGMTPLQGLVMGTRSGDIDPGLFAYLARVADMDSAAVDTFLNKRSGMIGMTGGMNDFRHIMAAMDAGDEAAHLAFDVYVHRLVGYIGSYHALLGGTQALVFTAGVGENAQPVRAAVCERLAPLGFWLDPELNRIRQKTPWVISRPNSPIAILVVPTNEELAMARATAALTQ